MIQQSGLISDRRHLGAVASNRKRRAQWLAILVVVLTIQTLVSTTNCQDLDDLNKQTSGNLQLPQFTFQTINRQQQQQQQQQPQQQLQLQQQQQLSQPQPRINSNAIPVASPTSSPSSAGAAATGARQTTATRPLLSTRFAPPQPSAQASSSSAQFAAPTNQQQQQQQQQQSSGNIDQIMRSALARSVRVEAAEARQDGPTAEQIQQPQSRSGQASQPSSTQDKLADASEPKAAETVASKSQRDNDDDQSEDRATATTAAQTTTANGHETVYSDQRFANLFARRNTMKKTKINPTEQVKAKPTLPSFIKSPPDPKQFTATSSLDSQSGGQAGGRPATPATNFASARLQQQQNQGRINLANQQKKASAAAASLSASSANNNNNNNNNKLRNNANSSSGSRPSPGATPPKTAAASNPSKATVATASTSKPVASGNPFNRSQNSNDPANVIAMARKRLLANNALESGKLKQQQQQQKQQQLATANP